jgi:hypothetical protein
VLSEKWWESHIPVPMGGNRHPGSSSSAEQANHPDNSMNVQDSMPRIDDNLSNNNNNDVKNLSYQSEHQVVSYSL